MTHASEFMTFLMVAMLAVFVWLQASEPVQAHEEDYLTQLERAGAL